MKSLAKQNFESPFCFAPELCLSDEADWGQMWTETLLHGILVALKCSEFSDFSTEPG